MKKKSFFLGVVVGSTVGAITALLTAPKKGSEMRKDIKDESEKVYNNAKHKYTDLSEKVLEKYNKEVTNLKKLYEENTEKYKEELSKLNEKYFTKKDKKDLIEEEIQEENEEENKDTDK